MTIFKQPMIRFALRVALPAMLIVLAAIFAGILILRDMADQVDRIEVTSGERSVKAALFSNLLRLRETHGDYAVWDEAVIKLYGNIDQSFVESVLRDSTRHAVLFDTAYLLDEDDQFVFGYHHGDPSMRSATAELGASFDIMVRAVHARSRPYDAETGVLKNQAGDIFAVAVGSILPSTAATPAPARPRLLVLARVINAAALARMSDEFVLDDLAYAPRPSPDRPSISLVDPGGNQLGVLTWSASSQGRQAFERVAPTAYITAALICLTILFLLRIGYSNLLQLRAREQQAMRAANHDGLTGLPNRAALSRQLEAAVAAHDAIGTPVALIYLDLDGFKEVNDSYGHESGDFLLKHVAAGFSAILGDAGFLARVGGDEFAVVLDRGETVDEAEAISNRMVRFFDEPVDLQGRLVSVGTSVGIAIAREEAVKAEELLRRADVAMYLAKEFGRNRVAQYDPSIDAARTERMRLAEDLREAIRGERLAVVYQPIFDAVSMRPVGVEALLRWLHPELGLVPPDIFVPIAEESGQIEQIGTWVLRSACRDALDWPEVRLSVNVSPVQFRNPGFDTLLSGLLSEAGFPPERLEIEMTETHLVVHPDRAQAIIASLRGIGVTVSLDDFGTGYSSIGYLQGYAFARPMSVDATRHFLSAGLARPAVADSTV